MLGATLSGFKVRAYRSARDCKSLFKKSIKEIRHVPSGECALSLVLSTLARGESYPKADEVIVWGSPHAAVHQSR